MIATAITTPIRIGAWPTLLGSRIELSMFTVSQGRSKGLGFSRQVNNQVGRRADRDSANIHLSLAHIGNGLLAQLQFVMATTVVGQSKAG